jgi:tagatose 1,6-diphosphate aldolase
VDGDLRLALRRTYAGNPALGLVPSYTFDMRHRATGELLGSIDLRLSNDPYIVRYAGHIGYGVEPKHRGHHYAARACKLLLPLAKRHSLNPLWITCNPDNVASRRTCERLGMSLEEIIALPKDTDLYRRGEREKCRYRLLL